MQRRKSLPSKPLLRLLIGLYQNVKERKSWMYSSLTTSSILISETQQSTTCWVEQYVPGGSVLLKTIMEYSFALGCSVATLNHNSEMIFVLHFLSFGFSVETLLRIHF